METNQQEQPGTLALPSGDTAKIRGIKLFLLKLLQKATLNNPVPQAELVKFASGRKNAVPVIHYLDQLAAEGFVLSIRQRSMDSAQKQSYWPSIKGIEAANSYVSGMEGSEEYAPEALNMHDVHIAPKVVAETPEAINPAPTVLKTALLTSQPLNETTMIETSQETPKPKKREAGLGKAEILAALEGISYASKLSFNEIRQRCPGFKSNDSLRVTLEGLTDGILIKKIRIGMPVYYWTVGEVEESEGEPSSLINSALNESTDQEAEETEEIEDDASESEESTAVAVINTNVIPNETLPASTQDTLVRAIPTGFNPKASVGSNAQGDEVYIDLAKLVQTRMLIQAASGGGKSYAMRRMLEQTASSIQQIIIDPEGEFRTLAEKLPYLVCARTDGDIKIDLASGWMLANEVMRRKVSVIIDISDFGSESRGIFVATFIDQLMRQPQELWSHVLVFIDEAHLFCPQQDKSPAKKAVIDLAARGRKRGLCPVLATQRISKLNKSVAAELLNRVIGMTYLDNDIRRSADEMGISASQAYEMLPTLQVGEFYCYGPAINNRIQKMKIGPVHTRHGFLSSDILPPVVITDQMRLEIEKAFDEVPIDAKWSAIESLKQLAVDKDSFEDEIQAERADMDLRSKLETAVVLLHSQGKIAHVSQDEIDEALHRFKMITGEADIDVSEATLRRYRTKYEEAEDQFGSGIIGLLPMDSGKGNRTRKVSLQVIDLIHEMAIDVDNIGIKPIKLYSQFTEACHRQELKPVSSKTFVKEFSEYLLNIPMGSRIGTKKPGALIQGARA